MKKLQNKALSTIILSFIAGAFIMLVLIASIIERNSIGISKNQKQPYEKSSLAISVEKIYDAVVMIQEEEATSNDCGTGFFYKVDGKYGYILTNEHVIDAMEKAKVILSTGEEVTAEILGKDGYMDLAVLRINKKHVKLLATIGSSKEINLGDTVFTVGSPLGYTYRGSVTAGILSGKDRLVPTTVASKNNEEWLMKTLQVDASLNPGNSGGPLLNKNGEVIGICTMKLVKDNIEGMGFAIPIEDAMSYVDTLESNKEIKWPVLGITMVNVKDKAELMTNDMESYDDRKEGVVVIKVKENSAASKAGIKRGDIITEISGVKVEDKTHLKYELYRHSSGDSVSITYIRNNKENTKKVKLD